MWDIVFEPDTARAGFWAKELKACFGRVGIGRFCIEKSVFWGGEMAIISWEDVGVNGVGMMPYTFAIRYRQ